MPCPLVRAFGFVLIAAASQAPACTVPIPSGAFACTTDSDCADGGVCVLVNGDDRACGTVSANCPVQQDTCLRNIQVSGYGCVPAPDNQGEACAIDECSGGFCDQGVCVRDPNPCDDGEDCTVDECIPMVGCVHQPVDCPCQTDSACNEDNDRCNGVWSCVDGGCVQTTAQVDCSASEGICNTAACDPATGECVLEPTPGEPCGDGQVCNSVGACGPDEQGDSCNEAPDIAPLQPGASTVRIGTTSVETLTDAHEGSICGSGSNTTPGKDVVYRLIPSEDAAYRLSLTLGPDDSTLGSLFVFTDCEEPSCVDFDREGGDGGDLATIELAATAQQAYFIVVDGATETADGDYVLTVCRTDCEGKVCGDDGCGGSCGDCDNGLACVAGACDCPIAKDVGCGDTDSGLTGQHLGFETSSCSDGVNGDDPETVMRFNALESQAVTMQVTWSGPGSGNPPSGSMAVYLSEGDTCVAEDAMTCVAGVTNATSITFDAEAGQAYRWVIEPNASDVSFDYTVSCP